MLDALPIIVGVGQITERSEDAARKRAPLQLMADAAEAAIADAGATGIRRLLESVRVVNVISAAYQEPAGALGEMLGLASGERLYTSVGGNTPQWLVNLTADDLAAGRIRGAVLAGAEAMHALRTAIKQGVSLPWTQGHANPRMIGDTRNANHADEWRHGLQMPAQIYPLFEIALRARLGLTPAAHRRRIAELSASFAAVARDHPDAWFRDGKSADEIERVTARNRMVAFPYPKFMNAMLEVDQGAAVIMTTVGEARALGIPSSRWVHVHGGGDATDIWYVRDRADFHSSPAMAAAFRQALGQADVAPESIEILDLYSCFPVAPQIAAALLDVPADGTRPLTITGGLPYFGGPGNNYVMHAIATMVERLRERRDTTGLVSGLGWYLTKHSAGVYAARPPEVPWARSDRSAEQAKLDAAARPETVSTASGPACIETYTVLYDREGAAEAAVVVARLDDGRRVLTTGDPDGDFLAELERCEMVGTRGAVRSLDDGTNRFRALGA